jgi:hypothetical protein
MTDFTPEGRCGTGGQVPPFEEMLCGRLKEGRAGRVGSLSRSA